MQGFVALARFIPLLRKNVHQFVSSAPPHHEKTSGVANSGARQAPSTRFVTMPKYRGYWCYKALGTIAHSEYFPNKGSKFPIMDLVRLEVYAADIAESPHFDTLAS